MDTSFCLDALEDALRRGRPEIFNTDQGAQFTSAAFSDKLEAAGVRISMDGRGRWLDKVFVERLWRSLKYEEVHLKAYANGLEARIGIGQWFRFYNASRPHQALGYKTPAASWAAEVSPVDLPLRLDDAGVSQPTSGYDRLSAQTERDLASLNTPKGTSLAGCGVVCCIGRPMRVSPYSRS